MSVAPSSARKAGLRNAGENGVGLTPPPHSATFSMPLAASFESWARGGRRAHGYLVYEPRPE